MEPPTALPKDSGLLTTEHRSIDDLVRRMKSELCEEWLDKGMEMWGPTKSDSNLPPSWTGTITTKVGDERHYITCPGHVNGESCKGSWCRKDRQAMVVGIHCVFGGWVRYDGGIITAVHPTPSHNGGRTLLRLRRLWAEHVLSRGDASHSIGDHENVEGILDQDLLDQVHQMMEKVLVRQREKEADRDGVEQDREKTLGKGTGGWSGLTENGTVLKRDAGFYRIGNYEDRTDIEPGGMFERGDAEVWITWNGWSCFVTRDGRWRPGYHFEVLVAHWLTVVDYGLTRALYRDWQAGWLQTSEWVLVNTPLDMPQRYAEVFGGDVREMFRREKERSQTLKPESYLADDASTRARRYNGMLDRGGSVIAYHTVGEGLDSPRGLVAAWCMAVLNDIVDYERDVLCGETNNIPRTLTSSQQVVDAAAGALKAVCWAVDNCDFDLADAILGSGALYLVMWRYNGPKLARYEPISVLNQTPGVPPETRDIMDIVQPGGIAATDTSETYGDIYMRTEKKVRKAYGGCTCQDPTEGHDAWNMLAKAMDEGGNDDLEERLHVACVALNNNANAGDVNSECGVDLLLLECFVRTFDPETGIVA